MTIKILALNNPYGEVAGHLLSQAGRDVQVSMADSEQDALQLLQRGHFDLLILDYYTEEFLTKWRSGAEDTNVLTLVTSSTTDSPTGFVRAPLQPHEANFYIHFPVGLDTFLDKVNNLLAGASTQAMPGDEGYHKFKNSGLAVTFDYPAFWVISDTPDESKRKSFQYLSVKAVGPKNRSDGLYSVIEVSAYYPRRSKPLKIDTILASELSGQDNVERVTEKRSVEIGGVVGTLAEYTWSIRRKGTQHGRSIITTASRGENVYVLQLRAADDRFDDFRPIYAQLLATFQFLK